MPNPERQVSFLDGEVHMSFQPDIVFLPTHYSIDRILPFLIYPTWFSQPVFLSTHCGLACGEREKKGFNNGMGIFWYWHQFTNYKSIWMMGNLLFWVVTYWVDNQGNILSNLTLVLVFWVIFWRNCKRSIWQFELGAWTQLVNFVQADNDLVKKSDKTCSDFFKWLRR